MKLSDKDIEFGFWNIDVRKPVYLNFDDPRIETEEYLGLGFYNEHNHSKEIKEWNKRLSSLNKVKYLWTYHKLSQESFDTITSMSNLRGLNIKWSSIVSLESIKNLKNVQYLNLGLSTSILDLEPVSILKNLITLESENLKKVKEWDSISELTNLEGLGINGGMYEALKLDSIDFVSKLKNLRYLFLTSTRIKTNSLEPIESLLNLECLRLNNTWKDDEFAKLRAKLPKLKYGNVALDGPTKNLNEIFKTKNY